MLVSKSKNGRTGLSKLVGIRTSGMEKRTGKTKIPTLEEFLEKRDYTGAVTLLNFKRRGGENDQTTLLWLAFSYFHQGDYQQALEVYKEVEEMQSNPAEAVEDLPLYKACCLYYLQEFEEAKSEAQRGPRTPLHHRLLFHIAQKLNNEQLLMKHHQALSESPVDQFSLAAMHFLRGHYQEAVDIYKRILVDNPDALALNVFMAMSYYKLDYYDVALEVLAVYLQAFPLSLVASNLKACNQYRLYNGVAAEDELKALAENDPSVLENELLKHNLVVFREGEGAMQVLPPLVDVIPEARLNLAVYYLKKKQVQPAFDLIKDIEPSSPPEYILKAIVYAEVGQEAGVTDQLKTAQEHFQIVGSSASECDTIPGRQCMASCFFLLKQFEDANIYLKSIKAYLGHDDNFNWNYGISLAAAGDYKEGRETLQKVEDEESRADYVWASWMAKCHIYLGESEKAWELYLRMATSADSFSLLLLIATFCYQLEDYYYAAKAFDVLERLDPDIEYWEGKRGACIGVLQKVLAGKEKKERMQDVMVMLRNSVNSEVEEIVSTVQNFCTSRGIAV